MMVRGKNNLRATSTDKSSLEPLIVLDGVIYSGQMTDINPNDIEQIDVLKDASSTAVYGAKAANGVVLITTKKGTSSTKPIINFSGTWGLSMVNSLPEVYEGEDFINFRRDVEVSKNPSKQLPDISTIRHTCPMRTWQTGWETIKATRQVSG